MSIINAQNDSYKIARGIRLEKPVIKFARQLKIIQLELSSE